MKYPNHITLDLKPMTRQEVEPLVRNIRAWLKDAGIEATLCTKRLAGDMTSGYKLVCGLDRKIVGRDRRKAEIHCSGFKVVVRNTVGRDKMTDGNGMFVPADPKRTTLIFGIWPCMVRLVGRRRTQYEAFFRFYGDERGYRCSSRRQICGESSYDYDTDISKLDFSKNIKYLAGIRPYRNRKAGK